MLKCIFMLIKTRLNTSGSVYGRIVILKRWICEALVRLSLWKQSSRRILSSAVSFAAAVLWLLDTILFSVLQSLSLSFGFRPPFFLADDVFPWIVYALITLETVALDTLNKCLLWLQMLQLNVHQQSVLFENLASLPFCSTFIRTVTKHNLMHWHWHYTA